MHSCLPLVSCATCQAFLLEKVCSKHKRTVYLLVCADKRGRFSYLTKAFQKKKKAFHVTALAGLEKTVILRGKSVPEELLVEQREQSEDKMGLLQMAQE